MTNNQAEKDLKAVEEILTKPVFIGFSEETIRVRRNLLTIAFFVVIYQLSELKVNEFSFLGAKFANAPSKEFLDITLLCLIIYHLIHFLWQSIDAYQQCRIRMTGTDALFMKNDNEKESSADSTLDPLQSSLLNWLWKRTKPTSSNFIEAINRAQELTFEGSQYHQIHQEVSNIKALLKVINDNRTLVSLIRFENFCKCFTCSQILRWYILEFGVPVGLALFAMSQTYQPLLIWVVNFLCL
jgi:hypothetical protein